MHVIFDIIKINKMLSEYFDCNIYDMFLNGYCLEYYNILKLFYPDCMMVIEKNTNHIACLIDENIYDVAGFCNSDCFFLVNENDLNFIYSFYNKFSDELKCDIIKYIKSYEKTIK